jgi:catechol 2,3-dioxygenase-like lactoylglutathione lyase family enzyme
MAPFTVLQIDHVELFVPDRMSAAEWYRETLGLEIVEEFRFWAEGDGGPLMIGTREGGTKLALFEGTPQASRPTVGFHRVAFRVGGESFIEFLESLDRRALKDRRDQPVTIASVFDHQKAFSIYFSDPYGHNLEITTYDHEQVRAALASLTPS